MKSTNKRVKLDRTKLLGFNQTKDNSDKSALKSLKAMIGDKGLPPGGA